IAQQVQVANLGDSCNECGNCQTFCPTAGAPYKDKPKFWADPEAFEEAAGNAFRLEKKGPSVHLEAKLGGKKHSLERTESALTYRGPELVARLDPKSFQVIEVSPAQGLADGAQVDLAVCASLIPLLAAAAELPLR